MPYRRATLLAAALFAAAALAPAASAQIQLGRYGSRHGGALLRCGGFAGTCAPVGRNFPPIFDTAGFPCTVLP